MDCQSSLAHLFSVVILVFLSPSLFLNFLPLSLLPCNFVKLLLINFSREEGPFCFLKKVYTSQVVLLGNLIS